MFKAIQEYYQYLENDNSILNNHNISRWISNLIDKCEDDKLRSEWTYELFFTDFKMEFGEVRSHLSYTDGQEYPNYDLFDDDLAYIKIRAENTQNTKYKAKYYHLLWGSKQKHLKYAKQAVDSYYEFLKNVRFPFDDALSNKAFEKYFENLFSLAQEVNYRKEEILQVFISIIGTKRVYGYAEYILMRFVTEKGKKIDKSIIQNFYRYSSKVLDENNYPEFVEDYLLFQILLCQKLNISSKPYHNKLAEFYIEQSEQQKESFVVHDIYLRALPQYQKAGNKDKIEEVTVLIEKAKKNINFKAINVELKNDMVQQLYNNVNKITDELIEKCSSKGIFGFVILSDRIFPKAKVLNEKVSTPMLDIVNIMNFDINKNVSSKKESGINPYLIHIQNFTILWLGMIFQKGIKNRKISYETLTEYMRQYSWYGTDTSFINADGESEGFNWMELLTPSLFSFFNQMDIDINLNKEGHQEYILAIDSLVIKFEGLLREFSHKIGAQTIEIKENGTQERISFEKLFDNQKLVKIIPEDDIALFKFLFTPDGMNLRNNIAHCFYKTKNYSSGIMLLVITAVLKLGNYKLIKTESSISTTK